MWKVGVGGGLRPILNLNRGINFNGGLEICDDTADTILDIYTNPVDL